MYLADRKATVNSSVLRPDSNEQTVLAAPGKLVSQVASREMTSCSTFLILIQETSSKPVTDDVRSSKLRDIQVKQRCIQA